MEPEIEWRWWAYIARADENITRKFLGFGQGGKCVVYRREGSTLGKSFAFLLYPIYGGGSIQVYIYIGGMSVWN